MSLCYMNHKMEQMWVIREEVLLCLERRTTQIVNSSKTRVHTCFSSSFPASELQFVPELKIMVLLRNLFCYIKVQRWIVLHICFSHFKRSHSAECYGHILSAELCLCTASYRRSSSTTTKTARGLAVRGDSSSASLLAWLKLIIVLFIQIIKQYITLKG